jgi:hypothetical protein
VAADYVLSMFAFILKLWPVETLTAKAAGDQPEIVETEDIEPPNVVRVKVTVSE